MSVGSLSFALPKTPSTASWARRSRPLPSAIASFANKIRMQAWPRTTRPRSRWTSVCVDEAFVGQAEGLAHALPDRDGHTSFFCGTGLWADRTPHTARRAGMSLFMRFPLGFCVFLAVALLFPWESRRSYEVSTTEVHFPFRIAIRRSNSVENRMEHRHWICVARSVHAQSVEHRSHFLGRHPAGSTVDDLAAKIGHAHSGESLSRIFRDERRHRLQVFTKL